VDDPLPPSSVPLVVSPHASLGSACSGAGRACADGGACACDYARVSQVVYDKPKKRHKHG
jgi:hypothetical protein